MSTAEPVSARAQVAPTGEQQEVIAKLGAGPVKVAAAAGSGKTTTMAWLYAAALAGQLGMDQIMAVTFTDRAAAELRRKVAAVLAEARLAVPGVGVADLEGAWIGTFHHLVRRLLSERAYLAGLPRDLELIDEVSAELLMRETVSDVRRRSVQPNSWLQLLPPDPGPRAVLALLEGVTQAVRRLRSTALDPDACERLSEQGYRVARALGDPASELAWHGAALRVTLAVWRDYERRLAARGATDFDGLLREGLLALQGSPRLRNWCRAQFRLVIVDEFQDTSALQEELILELTGPTQRSLFMVGDARQSIYAFRDAKPGIMAEAAGRTLPMFRNHRSREHILSAADRVIKQDPQFAADQAMEAYRAAESSLPVFIAEVETVAEEAELIAAALAGIHRQGIAYPDGTRQAVAWREMAVLAYTQGRLGPFLEEAMRRRDIPFQTATGGLLARPEVRDALALLRLTADGADDLACLRVLQSQVVRIPDAGLLALRTAGGHPRVPLAERLREHLERGAPGWERPWADRGHRMLQLIGELRLQAQSAPAAEVLSRGMEESGLLPAHQARADSGDPGGWRAVASLRELQRLAWAAAAPGRWLELAALLDRLVLMSDEAKTAEPPLQTDEDLVTLSTIHRAKGLEWEVVVLADCRPFHPRGPGRILWDRPAQQIICTDAGAGATAAYRRWKATPAAAVEREEHRRLVYVAMTRAKDLLLVTTSRKGKEGEFFELAEAAESGSPWVCQWPQFPGAERLTWTGEVGTPSLAGVSRSRSPQPPVSPSQLTHRWEELAGLRRRRRRGPGMPEQLSFTSIELLRQCPRMFWYQHLAHFPEPLAETASAGSPMEDAPRAAALQLGVVVHAALERLHTGAEAAPAATARVRSLVQELGDGLSPAQRSEAEAMLNTYLALPTAALPTVATEFAFTWSDWAGPGCPPLVGLIDRIARLPQGGLLLIDYKTNRSLGATEQVTYARQLQLYAAAVEAGVLGAPVAAPATALVMLRSGQLIPVESGAQERRQALEWAGWAAGRVAKGDYHATDGFPERPCRDCAFQARCPERRQDLAPDLVGHLEET
ncbi:MAG: ATP-dependent helicase [Candidatus Dormibacteria bacterium]